jgi:VWFA-related protein
MLRTSKHLIAASLLILSFFAIPHAQQDSVDVIKIDTSLVTLNVSVTTKKDHPFSGLQVDDFLINDQGTPVTPNFFDGQGPASIVFVIDTSSSMTGTKWRNLTKGLKSFLAKDRPENDYSLIIFADRPTLIASSVNAEQLWQNFKGIKPNGETALYDALARGLQLLKEIPQRHKAIVLLTDGDDNKSHTTLELTQERVAIRHATIYSVGILQDEYYGKNGKELLTRLAKATGGSAFFPKADCLEGVLKTISYDIRNQYSLSYYPPDKTTGWRSVDIRLTNVARNDLQLSYQTRYLIK